MPRALASFALPFGMFIVLPALGLAAVPVAMWRRPASPGGA